MNAATFLVDGGLSAAYVTPEVGVVLALVAELAARALRTEHDPVSVSSSSRPSSARQPRAFPVDFTLHSAHSSIGERTCSTADLDPLDE